MDFEFQLQSGIQRDLSEQDSVKNSTVWTAFRPTDQSNSIDQLCEIKRFVSLTNEYWTSD